MNLQESLRMAWRALLSNRLRAALTMLGIVIGVAAVIALITTGQAATGVVTSQVQALGSNLVTVSPNRAEGITFKSQDVAWLLRVVPELKQDAPILTSNVTASFQNHSWSTSIMGTTPPALVIQGRSLAEGRYISASDVSSDRQVAVLGQTVVQQLFPGIDPVGQTINLNGIPFQVVGVLTASGGGFGLNADDVVVTPLPAAEWVAGTTQLTLIQAQAKSSALASLAVGHIDAVMNHRYGTTDAATVVSEDQLLSTLSTITATLTLMLGGIAGISLLVGGIGIMNIMLVTVSERTREIGLRKAVGATRKAILLQFLVESSLLSLAGGAIGTILGLALAELLTHLLGAGGISFTSVFLALIFSLVVGIVFGIWPALNASRLDPVQALYHS